MVEPSPCPKCDGPRRMRSNGSFGGKPRQKPYCVACENVRLKGHPSIAISKKRWNAENPEKRRAHKIVENAIAAGTLKPEPCERCGSPDAQAHHEDYSKPLEVSWLCPRDHKARHRELAQAA